MTVTIASSLTSLSMLAATAHALILNTLSVDTKKDCKVDGWMNAIIAFTSFSTLAAIQFMLILNTLSIDITKDCKVDGWMTAVTA